MIIKAAESRDADIEALNALMALPHVDNATKNKIDREIRNIRSGMAGEKEAAYNIDFHYENSKNWMVIHDLRLQHQGQSAQIDHVLINRFMEVYVCESKRFGEGITINEHGEFSAYYQGKAYGIPSPIEQNHRHITLLERLFDQGEIELPVRLGLKLKPKCYSLILIANNARITRPKHGKAVQGLDRIIKNEQVYKRIHKDIDEEKIFSMFASASKIISRETLQTFAENLAALHTPLAVDWKARFGIADLPAAAETDSPEAEEPAREDTAPQTANQTPHEGKHLFCAACKKTVTANVARYCWNNKARFGGRVYCYDCQGNLPGKP